MKKDSILLIIIASFLSGLGGAYLFTALGAGYQKDKAYEANSAYKHVFTNVRAVPASVTTASAPSDFVTAAEQSSPSVVFIKTVSGTSRDIDFWDFWNFFGHRGPISSAGSGVIVSADGYIVTNNHVIDNADDIEVTLTNKHTYKAKVIGTDPNTDLALLKIDAKNLPPIAFGNSDQVKIGEWVLAVGNPLNLTSTVTAGIVSAKGRNINIVNTQFPIESFIQTDAAINPGNSGGALVNTKGELIGINTAIASKTGAYSGYGFAIPVNIVKKAINDLKEFGIVQNAFLGAEVIDIDEKIADKLPDDNFSGVYVFDVMRESAASKAGIKEGDIILKIDGFPINSKAEYLERLSYYRPGETIKITLKRGKNILDFSAMLTNRDGTTEMIRNNKVFVNQIGCALTPLTKFEKQKYNIKSGIRISDIKGGFVRQLGLPENFIIISINNREVDSVEDVVQLLGKQRGRMVIEGIHPNGTRGQYSFFMY
ncbi:MAG: trypsin-like peptidase domain-containing protein [Bacteroidia bacterium]|nr:trypsin-like peptidase domain-containing protein [Bacteroidia bacterium]MDW8158548.1 trypsin-like peptidase domain-containing protein [Bacteroidia bacterium]